MSFDRLAPHYRWMEGLLAGSKLQKCRLAFLCQIPPPNHALLLGEGNGRFLIELCRAFPKTLITYVDASANMLDRARERAKAKGCDVGRVHFMHTDVLNWEPPENQFDLVVSHFFLDCFQPSQLARIVPRITKATTSDALWLLADFNEPSRGWARWRARWILKVMYGYFRWATHLPASCLTVPDPYLQREGFVLQQRKFTEWSLLHSDLWQRIAG